MEKDNFELVVLQSMRDFVNEKEMICEQGILDAIKTVAMVIPKKELEKAEQQLFGYYSAKMGETLTQLVKGMGLTYKEYCELNENGTIDYLPQEFKDQIMDACE